MSEHTKPTDPKPPSVDWFSQLWHRINDHKMVQWSVAYVAVAYAIQHGVTLTSDAFERPHAVVRVSMLLLALGLPLVMIFAWYHGARPSGNFTRAELTILSILLAVGSLIFYVFVQPSAEIATRTASTAQQAIFAHATSPAQPGGISVAVLPFVNLSSDKEQEFFSDGMTEEITSALAKVPNLQVVGRTSAFQFKGENKDLRAIGQALSATHLIEGSVRKAGNEVRITAQLIKADDGTHLWTESYNRELKGVFAVQEEIAAAIAKALRVPLGLKAGESLVANRTSDTDSYQDYLRAKALVRSRAAPEPGGPLTQAAKLLEQVVAREPNYAPAWGLLGQAYAYTPVYSAVVNGATDEFRRFTAASLQKAEAAALQATSLDPNSNDGYPVLALVQHFRGAFVQAEDLYKHALSLDPGNPDALHQYSQMLWTVGRFKDALTLRLRLQAQEPFVPVYNLNVGIVLWSNGRNDEAIAILKAAPPTIFRVFLAQVYASMGRYGEAADALQEIPPGTFRTGAVEESVRLLRDPRGNTASPDTTLSSGLLGFIYLYAGAPDRVLDFYEDLAEAGFPALGNLIGLLGGPSYEPVRNTHRHKAFARKAGLVDYWKARGWSDFCHPTTGDGFECN